MRWPGIALFASGWLLISPLPLARGEDNTLQYQYLKIYLAINTADQLEKQGNYKGALATFKDCYTRLQRIHNSDPSWESALVIHRMDDCRTKIGTLNDLVASQTGSEAATPAPDPGQPQTTTPASPDVAALRKQVTDLQIELADYKAKLQNSLVNATSLRTQLADVNQQLAAAKSERSEDKQVGKLLSQNKALTDKLAAAQKEIAAIKSPNSKSALSLLRTQLKNTQDQLALSDASRLALQDTTTTLRQQLDDVQADLRSANQKLAAAPPNAPEYETLKHENEVMREILTRELQEQAHRDMAKRLAQEEFDRLRITSKVLQEQLDILGSPMTPATNDQERALLDGLRVAGTPVQPVPSEGNGNSFSASNATRSTPATNAVAVATPPVTPSASTNDVTTATNAPPSTAVASSTDTNSPAATPPPTNQTVAGGDNGVPPSPTTVTPATAPATVATDSGTNSVAGGSPSPTNVVVTPPPTTNSPAAATNVVVTPPPATNSAPDQGTMPTATNTVTTASVPTNAAPATTNVVSNPGSATNPPSATTNAAPAQEPAQYANKPRLPADMRDTAQQAADLFKMQRYDDAAMKYQQIIDKYPESLYAWSNLGVVRFQQGKMPEALKALQRAVSLSPTDAFSYQNLGIVYYQMGQYENAISALERALALDPSNAKSHNYLGCACSQKGWSEVAEKEFQKAIELNDEFGDAHFNLALVLATEKPPSIEMARRHYKRALELGISPDPRLEKLLQMDGVAQNPPANEPR